MPDYGLLSEVVAETQGSYLVEDAAAAATELIVEYAGDFDYQGGTLELNGAQLAYLEIVEGANPEDPDTVVLADPLVEAADAGDVVAVVVGGQVSTSYFAHVGMDEGDSVSVPIRYDQLAGWPIGIYDPPVPVTVSEDLQRLEDAPGRSLVSAVQFHQDTHTVTEAGPQDVQLSYLPIDNSEHVYWQPGGLNGVYMQGNEWTRDGLVITVPDEEALVVAGDRFTVEYAYLLGGPTAPTPEPEPEPEPDPDVDAVVIVPTNAVSLSLAPNYEGSIWGAAPQWGDDSLSSYASMQSKFGISSTNKFQGAETAIDAQPSLVTDNGARIAVWLKTTMDTHPTGLRIVISETAGSGAFLRETTTLPGPALTAPAGWEVTEMEPYPGHTIAGAINLMKSDSFLLFMVPALVGTDPPGTVYSEIRVAEARVAIYYPTP